MTRRPVSTSRRAALQGLLAAGALLAAGRAGAALPTMLRRPIPSSGEELPVVGMGTWQTFNVGSAPGDRMQIREVLKLFAQLGGTVVDSSPMYGRSEEVVGDLAGELGLHGRLFLATKVWTSGREEGIAQMRESMRRMRTERLDLIQVHNLLDVETHAETLKQWKAAGRVRYTGITHYHEGAHADLERWISYRRFDFVQVNYSLDEPESEQRVLPLAADMGAAVIVNRPFGKGSLFRRVRGKELPGWATEIGCATWAQFFLKWILANPAVTCVIPATSKPHHMEDNMQAGLGALPDPAMRRRMRQHMESF